MLSALIRKIRSGICLAVVSGAGCGQATRVDFNWINQLKAGAEKAAQDHHQEALQIVRQAQASQEQALRCPAVQQIIADSNQARKSALPQEMQDAEEGRYPRLLVLVSFSMPPETLKTLGVQLQKAGGQMVFRGLVNNSFPETAQKLKALGVEALIDPTLFEALKVEVVPAFVHFARSPASAEALPPYDILKGNVSLVYALQQFRDKGETDGATVLLNALGATL